ncbi:PPE domain-containing protein [Mycobacterium haemophilum]
MPEANSAEIYFGRCPDAMLAAANEWQRVANEMFEIPRSFEKVRTALQASGSVRQRRRRGDPAIPEVLREVAVGAVCTVKQIRKIVAEFPRTRAAAALGYRPGSF